MTQAFDHVTLVTCTCFFCDGIEGNVARYMSFFKMLWLSAFRSVNDLTGYVTIVIKLNQKLSSYEHYTNNIINTPGS